MRLYKLGLLALLACDDHESFIPLEALCQNVATDLCEAREACCGVDSASCIVPETTRCAEEVDLYVNEPGLQYDAVSAERKRSANRALFTTCSTVPPIAGFFQSGAALGTPCERATQCASGSCLGEPRVCAEPAPVGLCPAPPAL